MSLLQLNTDTRYYWHNGFTDMRKGFNSLCGLVQEHMHTSVVEGGVFIFINKNRNQLKLLHWEGDGLALYYKRLEQGRYELPPITGDNRSIGVLQLQLILQGIVLSSVRKKPRFTLAATL
jgi:transposase